MSLEARIAYDNQSKTAGSIIATDNKSGIAFLSDNMTTLKWRPLVLVSNIRYSGFFLDVDYVGIAGVNWEGAGATLSVKDNDGVELALFTGLADNQPAFAIIERKTQSAINFDFTCLQTTLEVGEIYFGQSIVLPKSVSVGYQPARWSNNDIITTSITEGNRVAGSTIRARGSTERFSLNFLDILFMETVFKAILRAAKGIPIFFIWDVNNTNQAIYGMWDVSDPSFGSSVTSSVSFTIRGDYGFVVNNGLTGSQGANSGGFR